MDTNPLFTAALGLVSPWRVARSEFNPDQRLLELWVDFAEGSRFVCPACQKPGCGVHDTEEKKWRHLDFFQHQAYIIARVPRVKCDGCGLTRQVTVPWARAGSGFTLLAEVLILELARNMPVRPLARLLGITAHRIWRVVKFYVREAVKRIDCSKVRWIGVDETSAKRNYDYITVIYDLDLRRLIFATKGREHQTIDRFARFMGAHRGDVENVTEVSCDMAPAFIKGVRDFLPNAEVTFDRFHIAQVLTDAVDQVRRAEWRRDRTVKGARYALLKNPDNLTAHQQEQLREITSRNAALAEVYRMKETFRDFYRQPNLESATGFLKGWIVAASKSSLKPLVHAAKTLLNRHKGILRWHTTHLNNAVMEGLNSLLQAAKRKARGYRLHDTFIMMAYLIAGKLDVHVRSPYARS